MKTKKEWFRWLTNNEIEYVLIPHNCCKSIRTMEPNPSASIVAKYKGHYFRLTVTDENNDFSFEENLTVLHNILKDFDYA